MLALVSFPAIAGDFPVAKPVFDWTGLYLGVASGYGVVSSIYNEREGGFGCGQVGYNFQYKQLVVGIEADGAAGRITENTTTSYAISNTIGGMFSVRGRIGFAFDQLLLYGTAGVAYAKNEFYWDNLPNPAIGKPLVYPPMVDSHWHDGWTAGAGIEYALSRNWSARAEYTYARFSARDYLYLNSNINRYGFNMSSARIGVNYHF